MSGSLHRRLTVAATALVMVFSLVSQIQAEPNDNRYRKSGEWFGKLIQGAQVCQDLRAKQGDFLVEAATKLAEGDIEGSKTASENARNGGLLLGAAGCTQQ